MSNNIKFFSDEINVNFEEPKSIELKGKTFHLSGDFANGKSEFANLIIKNGGHVRGIDKTTEQVVFCKTDYFVSADNGTNGRPYGGKAIKVQRHNNRDGVQHIPIIKESTCKKLIDEYVVIRTPKIK